MKLLVELDEKDKGTPIEMADAVIRHYTDRMYIQTEDDINNALDELAQVAEHILVYLNHNRPVIGRSGMCYTDGTEMIVGRV